MQKKNIKLSLISPSKIILNKKIDYMHSTSRFVQHPHFYLGKKDFKISKKKYSYNCDASVKYPSILLEKKIFKRNTQRSLIDLKKIDSSTQSNFTPIKSYKIPKIKSTLLKNLFVNFPQKNPNPINSVLESPHRGVERLQNITSFSKDKNNYTTTFYKNNLRNLSDIDNFSFTKYKKHRETILDKYNKTNKKIDNPLESLSKMSGVSSSKLRKIIDFSLSAGKKYLEKNIINKVLINNKILFENHNYKNIYSMIALKSKKKNEIINDNSTDIENDASFEKVMSTKKFNNIKAIC